MIRFLQGNREVAVEALRADLTVLDYLREHCALTGTKEGCASGDCGACTAVAVSASDGGLRYEPFNSCIAPLGSLHGKQLVTVEDLADGGTLHPVQRAMIEEHGSQCGFCTPGFVMSLFALYHREGAVTDAQIHEALGGNLCRCTGYRPIVDAARRALTERPADAFVERRAATVDRLRLLSDAESDETALVTGASRYFRPRTAAALAALLAQHETARLVAGATDLFLEVTQDLEALPVLIDLCSVDELQHIEVTDETITISAAVTHREATPALLADYPELAELIERFGSLQIRTRGTVVGNLATASPVGDWPPVFLALDGRVILESAAGSRECALDGFFTAYRETDLQPGEYIRALRLPRRPASLFLRAWKISKRFEDDISSVCGVFALEVSGDRVVQARVAFGGMAEVPKRAAACEAALTGADLAADTLAAAAQALVADFTPISDARASADYRALVARRLIDRLRAELHGEATRVRPPHAASPGAATDG